MKNTLRACVAFGLGVALASAAFGQRTFTNQYSFGDSLTDTGNAFLASGGAAPGGPPYYMGRWSNGPVYAERLGNTLILGPSSSTNKGSMNFAYGGATAVPAYATTPFPSLPQQLAIYQGKGIVLQKTDLVTIWAGANDIINNVSNPNTPGNPAIMDVAGVNAAQSTAAAVQTFVSAGAKNIVVLNMPDIGRTPGLVASGTGATFATRGSLAYNTEIDSRLAAITSAAAADVNIVRIDVRAVLDRVITDYKVLGFTTASVPYTSALASGGSAAAGDPNNYVFFDAIHPTAKTHALLAAVVNEALNPEPVVGWAATEGTAALALESLARKAIGGRLLELTQSQRSTGRADAYVVFNYGDGNRAADGYRPEFDFSGHVVTAGFDVRVSDGVFLGGAVDIGRSNVDVAGGLGNYTLEDTSGSLYALWRGGPLSLGLDTDYGVVTAKDIHRATAFSGFRTTGKTSGTHWGAGATAAWTLDTGSRFELRPLAGLRYERVKLDAYTEQDVPSLALQVDAQEAESFAGFVGIEAGTSTKVSGRDLRFDFHAAWHGEIGSSNRNVSGRLANNFTRSTVVTVEDGDGSGVELGIAATLKFAKDWSATLGYAGDIRNNEDYANRVTLSLHTGF